MHIDFCASAGAVHARYPMMKAVFCWAWNGDKQVPFSTRLPRVKKGKKKCSFGGGLSPEPGATGCDG